MFILFIHRFLGYSVQETRTLSLCGSLSQFPVSLGSHYPPTHTDPAGLWRGPSCDRIYPGPQAPGCSLAGTEQPRSYNAANGSLRVPQALPSLIPGPWAEVSTGWLPASLPCLDFIWRLAQKLSKTEI